MFSQSVEYALRACVFLASAGAEPATRERIAAATRVPSGYLSKIMRDLVVADLVTSQRGPQGGFALARSSSSISVLDVVTAIDPIHRITECPLGKPEHASLCPLHRRLDAVAASVEDSLRTAMLDQVLDGTPATHCCGPVAPLVQKWPAPPSSAA